MLCLKCTFSKPRQETGLARTQLAHNTGLEGELRQWRWGRFHNSMKQVPESHDDMTQSVIVGRR